MFVRMPTPASIVRVASVVIQLDLLLHVSEKVEVCMFLWGIDSLCLSELLLHLNKRS